jgi:hypothetical protein
VLNILWWPVVQEALQVDVIQTVITEVVVPEVIEQIIQVQQLQDCQFQQQDILLQ